jgi:hypothetical protein
MTQAELIVQTILTDLHLRKGVGDELDAIDPDVYQEMKGELIRKVRALL